MSKRACRVCESEDNLESMIDLCVSCFYPGRILFFCKVCKKRELISRDALRVVRQAVEKQGQKVTIPERASLIFRVNFCDICRASSQGEQFYLRVMAYGKVLN